MIIKNMAARALAYNSAGIIRSLIANDKLQSQPPRCELSLISLTRNFGKEAAMTAGLEAVRGDVVVLMDADGQHPVDLLPQMVAHWREGLDVVYAVRRTRDDPVVRDDAQVLDRGRVDLLRLGQPPCVMERPTLPKPRLDLLGTLAHEPLGRHHHAHLAALFDQLAGQVNRLVGRD